MEEGEEVVTSCLRHCGCQSDDANPPHITYQWVRESDGQQMSDPVKPHVLLLKSVERVDAGNYTCLVSNKMTQTVGGPETGKNERTVNVAVHCKFIFHVTTPD